MSVARAGLLVAGFFLLSVTAEAEPGTVFYKDGGRVSGDILEVRPDQFVVIRTETGETRRIDWDQVSRVSVPTAPPSPPALQAPPMPPPNAPPSEPPPEPPTATIIVRSNTASTVVQQITGRSVAYGYGYWGPVSVVSGLSKPLCTAPCSYRLLPGVNDLMVSAPGAPSASARLNLQPGENYLYAHMGSTTMITAGYAATTIGVIALITGTSLLFTYGFYSNTTLYSGYYGWGLASVIGGAVLTGGGIALMVLGNSSLGPDPEHGARPRSSGLPPARGVAVSVRF